MEANGMRKDLEDFREGKTDKLTKEYREKEYPDTEYEDLVKDFNAYDFSAKVWWDLFEEWELSMLSSLRNIIMAIVCGIPKQSILIL